MAEKTKAVAKKPGVFEIMAAKYNLDPQQFLNTLKATVMKPGRDGKVATNEEIAAFLVVAEKYSLNPFTNEIYAFPDRKRGGVVPVIGVDGFVTLINRHPDYDGMEITYSEDETTMDGAKSCPDWCEVKIYHKNIDKPTVVREYLDEVYCPARGEYKVPGPWQTHTKRMLRHKTIIQAGRIAFGLTGIYDPDEAQRILEAEVVEAPTTKPQVEMPQAKSQIENRTAAPEISPDSSAAHEQQPGPVDQTAPELTMSNLDQQKAIHTLATRLKMKEELLYATLEEDYGVKSTKDLTYDQAGEVIEKLSKQLTKQVKNAQGKP